MVYKSFRFQVILRVCLMFATTMVCFYSIFNTEYVITPIMTGLISFIFLFEILHYVDRTNRELSVFFSSIRFDDFTKTYDTKSSNSSFNQLYVSFNEVINHFKSLRIEKEAHFQYLLTVYEHVDIPLICFQDNGKVELVNQAAHKLLELPYISELNDLSRVDIQLPLLIESNEFGRQLHKIVINGEIVHLAIRTKKFKMQEIDYTLVSLQNIRTELEENEVETWQKVIRVLTHEIMNSVTPIISLTQIMRENLESNDLHAKTENQLLLDSENDFHTNLQTIERRTKGLLKFINAYRDLNKLPEANFITVPVSALLNRIQSIMKGEIEKNKVTLQIQDQAALANITIDPEMIEQVFINLLINAIQAIEEQNEKLIFITALQTSENRIVIKVKDNGKGIDQNMIDQIFIPFFTTKQNGSGIGLSLSRQIMKLHKGHISVSSQPKQGTTFSLVF